jgi:hypothetical protein
VLIDEIVHTCSNEKVAQAAVASLGFAFVSRIKTAADLRGVTIGAFAAKVVREFGDDAQLSERHTVDRAMQRSDHPILRGLQMILEKELEEPSSSGRGRWPNSGIQRGCGCVASP